MKYMKVNVSGGDVLKAVKRLIRLRNVFRLNSKILKNNSIRIPPSEERRLARMRAKAKARKQNLIKRSTNE